MKTIIAGSRTINDYDLLKEVILKSEFEIDCVISGFANGVDMLGVKYAGEKELALMVYKADWNRYGKKAGYIRNEEMAQVGDALIYLYDGVSKGTQHMINLAKEYELKIFGYSTLTKEYE